VNLPGHPDIERLILGYGMRGQGIDAVRGALEADDFSLEAHRRIWNRMVALYDSGKGVDHVEVFKELAAHSEAESVGGLSALVSLADGIPDLPRVDGYIERLKDASLRRRMILQAQRLAQRAADETESAGDVLSGFASVSTELADAALGNRRPVSTHEMLVEDGISAILEPRRSRGVNIPWPKLNRDLNGISPGQMVVLLAATSRGKTSMALQVATSCAGQGLIPVIWTMEMSPRSLFRRMVTQLSSVQCGRMSLSFDERQAQNTAIAMLDEHPIYFDRHSRSVGSFVASLRHIRSRGKIGVAIVDYLQLIRGNGRNRAQEVSENSRALKLAAMDLEIPFWVLAQVDRGSVKGDGAKIGLHSAKESGDVENDADVVMWVESGELSREQDTAVSVHVGKQREGPAGFSVPMVFRPTSQTFMEMAADE
jgi:replicative DNA helicase